MTLLYWYAAGYAAGLLAGWLLQGWWRNRG